MKKIKKNVNSKIIYKCIFSNYTQIYRFNTENIYPKQQTNHNYSKYPKSIAIITNFKYFLQNSTEIQSAFNTLVIQIIPSKI